MNILNSKNELPSECDFLIFVLYLNEFYQHASSYTLHSPDSSSIVLLKPILSTVPVLRTIINNLIVASTPEIEIKIKNQTQEVR